MKKYNLFAGRESEQIAKVFKAFLSENDIEFRDEFMNMPQTEESPLITCILNLSTKEYLFVSENVFQNFGLKAEELKKNGLVAALNLFTETHRPILIDQILPTLYGWYESFCKQKRDPKRTRLSYNLNMYDGNGRQISTIHFFTPLAVNDLGFPMILSKHIFRSPLLSESQSPKMVLEYLRDSGEIEIIYEKSFQVPGKAGEVLSTREKEILELMKEGHSSKEIASKLYISVNTFYNHRKNILKKYNSKQLLQVLTHG
jgi:DNA-binding CsgD family transcriptional regulator